MIFFTKYKQLLNYYIQHRPVDQKMFDFSVKKGIEVQRSWIKTVVPYGIYRFFLSRKRF